MKRIFLLLLAAVLCCLLCACSLVPSEYVSVRPHSEGEAAEEVTDALQAKDFDQLKRAILSFVQNSVEHGVIHVSNYDGDVEEDLSLAAYQVARENPLGAYAVDYMTHSCSLIVSYYEIHIDIAFRRTAEEIKSVNYTTSGNGSKLLLKNALTNYRDQLVMYLTDYQELDYGELAREYYELNPTRIIALPEIHTSVYPETGDARIVELTFDYPYRASVLKSMEHSVSDELSAAAVYVRFRSDQTERASLLLTYLSERFAYREGDPDVPLFSFLCEGVATNQSAAVCWQQLCERSSIPCYTVHGSREGAEYWWNIIELDEICYHVDVFEDLLNASSLTLRSDNGMGSYYWDTEAYPACVAPPVSEEGSDTPPEATQEPLPEEQPPEEQEQEPPTEEN